MHEMLTHDYTVPGLSDGGARVGRICDGSFRTTLIQHWIRDTAGPGWNYRTSSSGNPRDTARSVGLPDRGELAPGTGPT